MEKFLVSKLLQLAAIFLMLINNTRQDNVNEIIISSTKKLFSEDAVWGHCWGSCGGSYQKDPKPSIVRNILNCTEVSRCTFGLKKWEENGYRCDWCSCLCVVKVEAESYTLKDTNYIKGSVHPRLFPERELPYQEPKRVISNKKYLKFRKVKFNMDFEARLMREIIDLSVNIFKDKPVSLKPARHGVGQYGTESMKKGFTIVLRKNNLYFFKWRMECVMNVAPNEVVHARVFGRRLQTVAPFGARLLINYNNGKTAVYKNKSGRNYVGGKYVENSEDNFTAKCINCKKSTVDCKLRKL